MNAQCDPNPTSVCPDLHACNICGQLASEDDTCPDGNCRACHVSLSFEDCCDGTWNARVALKLHPIEEVRRRYPNAKL